MEDDIFKQLASLVNDKPDYTTLPGLEINGFDTGSEETNGLLSSSFGAVGSIRTGSQVQAESVPVVEESLEAQKLSLEEQMRQLEDSISAMTGIPSITSDEDTMFSTDDVIVPDYKPQKVERTKKLVVVIDDDFSTLDLMKIYLLRDYEYVSFDDPRNAIFYLNSNIPDLIFVDCFLNTMNSKRLVSIIKTYKELADVPIVYLAEGAEVNAIKGKLPEGVTDIISRPVKRGDLQALLDKYFPKSQN